MITVSREEFMTKYGNVKVQFSSYYKFTFTFTGNLPDGRVISVNVGGGADEIYRMEVAVGFVETVADLEPIAGRVSGNGQTLECFYDY